ncbi:hypothetical protein BDM02DRAFT_3132734 [Thelephora ganbajun]|uniref:Uncharacterized protein n=1 Tax=Thelephora ganbajun TaxID=370292 RepID=A0ACB6YZX4_THEGA|nr:hypothetical protein BDM02DRAFT_3132734 [Thelephora ganbajun]
MPSNLHQLSPDPPSSPDMDAIYLPSSRNTSTSPSTGGDLQLNSPTFNDLWVPYGHGFGLSQSHASSIQFGDRLPMGRPRECSTTPSYRMYSGRSMEPFFVELFTANNLMQRQITRIDQRLTELMQVFSYTSAHPVSSAAGMPAPAIASTGPQKSNLERLYEATPEVVMPKPLERNESPGPRFWEEYTWVEWSEREKEKGTLALDTPATTLDYFHARMELMFPELRLCTDHWKTDRIWIENFSSWTQSRRAKGPPGGGEMGQPGPPSKKVNIFQ